MRTFVFTCLLLLGMTTFAQDANFHIYLCLGQSNMEGNAKVEEQDTVAVDSRFQVLAAVDCPNLGRTKGNWYKAVPPLARCYTGLTPGDYFGRVVVFVDNRRHAERLVRHFAHGVKKLRCRKDLGDFRSLVHHVFDVNKKSATESTARMLYKNSILSAYSFIDRKSPVRPRWPA